MKTLVRKVFAALTASTMLLVTTAVTGPAAQALPDGLALTPPMGFNNWNATGCAVDEQLIRDTADLFVSKGLKAAGYQYVNIDDCWAAPERDAQTGRLLPHPVRFPSGIRALADYVHARGLKLGIYTSAGTVTCAKTMPGGLDHEEVDAQTFADWTVDYLKYDNCNNANRPFLERYTRMRDALKKTGRPIVYSICEWGQNKPWEWGKDVGHLWRTTGDINDTWAKTVEILKKNAPLAPYAGPGHWNDPDMLEVGNGGMTDTEYRSHFSLWSMMAAPLLIGADLRKVPASTYDILLNSEIIALDQDRLGVQARVLSQVDGKWIFVKPLAGGDVAVALFNENSTAATISTDAQALGLPKRAGYGIRDLWQHRDFQTAGTLAAVVPPHGTVVYRVKASGLDWLRHQPAVSSGLELTASVPGVPARVTPGGRPFEATVTATNHARIPVLDAKVRLEAPAGWRVEPLGGEHKWVLGTGESVAGRWRITPPTDAPPGSAQLTSRAEFTWAGGRVSAVGSAELTVPPAPPRGSVQASDAQWALENNGYGPVERDMSNGSWKPRDGKPLSIGGVKYAKGLGTHAPSEIVFYLGGKCSAFTAQVGIDDERDERQTGAAGFELWADGIKVADSGVRTWKDGPVPISANLAGAQYLRLVVNDGGDTSSYDRGDWAAAGLDCQP